MEVKTKEDWLYQFRRCSSRETLEKVISHTRYKLTPAELEAFNSAVDNRLAELTMNKLYDRAPASVWKYVTLILKQRYDDSGVICTGGPGTLSGIATTKNSKSKGNGAGGVGGNRLIFRYYRLTTCG